MPLIAGHHISNLLDPMYLRGVFGTPRVHENGFIQIDLDDRARLHVWGSTRIPRQKTYHPIHDHIFGFVSHVLKGRMVNIKHDHVPGKLFRVYVPQRDGDGGHSSPLVQFSSALWDTRPYDVTSTPAGGTYTMHPREFHESMPAEPTVTVIVKDAPTFRQNNDGRLPRILIPVGVEPDNFFSRSHDLNELWDIIGEVLAS